MLFGPFGDPYRRDPRSPWTGEAYFEIHPRDAVELGLNDGDYAWIDADPADRPYRNWKDDEPYYDVARAMMRARVYSGHDAWPHPHVVQHVRRHARHGRSTGARPRATRPRTRPRTTSPSSATAATSPARAPGSVRPR